MTTQDDDQPSPLIQPHSPKTLTLDTPIPCNSDQFEEDQDDDDVEMLTPVSQSTAPNPTRRRSFKRKKPNKQKRRAAAFEKKRLKKLGILNQTLKPIPFRPNKKLDFSRHEALLKRIGIWDFVHLEFDSNIHTDLIAQIIANYNSNTRSSYVNGTRILVNRADLSRALKLTVRKDKGNLNVNASDGSVESCEKESEESIGFIQEVVSNWMLLHDDTWMMPQDVLNVMKMIKEGNFEKICWATLVWFMVEKELTNSKLENCYYASHLQCLIKCQKAELLREEVKQQQGEMGEEIKEEEEEVKEEEEEVRGEARDEEERVREEVKDEKERVKEEVKEEVEGLRDEIKDEEEEVKDGAEGLREEVNDEEEEAREELKDEEEEVREEVEDEKEKVREEVKDKQQEVRAEVKDEQGVVRGEFTDEQEEGRGEVKDGEEEGRGEVKDEDEDCDGDVKMHDMVYDSKTTDLEEHNIELCLGQDNIVDVKENVETEKEVVRDDDAGYFGGNKNEQQGPWLLDRKNDIVEHENFLRVCSLGDVKVMDCDEDKKQEEEEEEGEEEGGEEEEDEEEQQHKGGFALSPEADALEMVSSANLIQGMETVQVPFNNGIQIGDDDLPGEFLSSRVDTHTNPGASSSHFGNGNKRPIDQENEVSHLNGGNKRLRSGGSWVKESSSDFHMCMEQIQHWMGKATMMYEAKDHICEESNVNQQFLINEVQKRDNIIEHLHKAKLEEQQKRQIDVYKLERELYVMANVLEGYRKALKETHKAFAEYRARCPQADEPLYKDVTGSGGLVLSTMELEKQRVKQEEERKKLEEEKKQEEERRKLEEEKKQEEERRKLEEEMKQEEERRKLEEEMKQEERRMMEDEIKKGEQRSMLEEEMKKEEEERKTPENDIKKQEADRRKLEEDEAMNCVLIEKKIKEFEDGWISNFEAHSCQIHMLSMKMLDVENEVVHLKELLAKQKVSEDSKCAPNE